METFEQNPETQLVGLLMSQPDLLDHCQVLSNFEHPFLDTKLNLVFLHIQKLYSEKGKFSIRDLMREGIKEGLQPDFYKILSSSAGFNVNIHDYVANAFSGVLKRLVQNLGHRVINCVQDETNTGSDYLAICREAVDSMEKNSVQTSGVTMAEAVQEVRDKAEMLRSGRTGEFYYKTGIYVIDNKIVGLTTKSVSVWAARPSVGKTAIALTVVGNMRKAGISTGVISVEMSESEIIERLAQTDSDTSIYSFAKKRPELVNGALEGQRKFMNSLSSYETCPLIQIERTTKRKIGNIRAIAVRMKRKNPELKVIAIDYMQKILGDDPRQDKKSQVGQVSNILTDIATELDVHIMALAQLNREGDEAPKVRNLKDCGEIEQDAHYIFLLHRNLQEQHGGDSLLDASVGIAKNRNGPTGKVDLKYNARTTKFYCDAMEYGGNDEL
jgi:replicative DNA helicase